MKSLKQVPREKAHGGSGESRLYVNKGEIDNIDWQAMTHGYLPAGSTFDWHHHDWVEETMLANKGKGVVADKDGQYSYEQGDLLHFPANQEHMIHNPTKEEHEFIFVRVAVRK